MRYTRYSSNYQHLRNSLTVSNDMLYCYFIYMSILQLKRRNSYSVYVHHSNLNVRQYYYLLQKFLIRWCWCTNLEHFDERNFLKCVGDDFWCGNNNRHKYLSLILVTVKYSLHFIVCPLCHSLVCYCYSV